MIMNVYVTFLLRYDVIACVFRKISTSVWNMELLLYMVSVIDWYSKFTVFQVSESIIYTTFSNTLQDFQKIHSIIVFAKRSHQATYAHIHYKYIKNLLTSLPQSRNNLVLYPLSLQADYLNFKP